MSNGGSSPVRRDIPHEVFDTAALPRGERFDVWRQGLLPLFEPRLEEIASEQFFARVDGFNLRRVFFGLSEFSAQGYLRRRDHRADEGADHLLVQLYMSGGYVGHNAGYPMKVGPGDISLLDLGYTLETRAEASSALSLVIPRDLMFAFARPERVGPGGVISGESAQGRILGQLLHSAWRSLHSASVEEEEGVCHTLVGAVAGAFASQGADAALAPALECAALDPICDYIERHLSSEQLTPAHLCRRFACSRAQLYRLFQPLGGVASFIRQARLRRCLRELGDPYDGPPNIMEVAMRWGFTSQSHFCRLFRHSFGITPTQAIERARSRQPSEAAAGWRTRATRPAFHDWLREL